MIQGRADSRPEAPRRALDLCLAAALVALLAARFLWITLDAPGGIVSGSGALVTDEGGYLKPAKLYYTFGVLRNDLDVNWGLYVAPLYTALTLALGGLFRNVLVATRYASVVFSVASVAVFYRLCRHGKTRAESLICCLVVAASLDEFTFSRVAFVEPLGTLLSLLALASWVCWRGRWRWVAASFAFAVLSVWCKLTFLYAALAVSALWAWEAYRACRGGKMRQAGGIVAFGLGAVCLLGAVQIALLECAGADAAESQGLMEKSHAGVTPKAAVLNELRLLWTYSRQPWREVPCIAAILGLAVLLARLRRGRERPAPPPGAVERCAGHRRPLAAMALWLILGMLFFGLFEYQVPRWLTFTIFPAAYLVASLIAHVATRRRVAMLLLVLALHVLAQVPSLYRYAARTHKTSLLDSARDVAARVGSADAPVALLGQFGHMAALFGDRIRPIATAWRTGESLRRRVARWRPAYFVGYPNEFRPIATYCRELLEATEPVASYRIMDNYYEGCDMLLLHLTYARAEQAGPRREAGPPTVGDDRR
ncbi:MAG TPA: hypothetical protein VNE39_11130 [Planctomycetota bacterium]|nr:hypothetical protein [Planctomycetota bacterium]